MYLGISKKKIPRVGFRPLARFLLRAISKKSNYRFFSHTFTYFCNNITLRHVKLFGPIWAYLMGNLTYLLETFFSRPPPSARRLKLDFQKVKKLINTVF